MSGASPYLATEIKRQNVGIAAGGAIFTDGANTGAVGSAAAGAWAGGMLGEYAPDIVNSVTGKELPGFIYDVIGSGGSGGSGGSEVVSGFIKDELDPYPENDKGLNNMFSYLKILIYSCIFCCVVYFILTGGAAVYIYLSKGVFFYPVKHVIRTCIFGMISGTAITAAAMVFNLIDKFKARKSPPSDPQ